MNTPFRTKDQLALNFTKEEGIEIQTNHLKEWRSVLSAPAFDRLERLVTADNEKAFDGFDIVRGDSIDMIVHNEVIPFFLNKQ
jgi:hypothetical protein